MNNKSSHINTGIITCCGNSRFSGFCGCENLSHPNSHLIYVNGTFVASKSQALLVLVCCEVGNDDAASKQHFQCC